MSNGKQSIEKLGYTIIPLKSAADVKYAKLRTTVDDLCSGEVSGDDFAIPLFKSENKKHLHAFKVVKSSDHEVTVAIAMYVSPMRMYSGDEQAKLLKENAKALGFDQEKQNEDAAELLVFCVKESARGTDLAKQILLHIVEDAQKKFIVVGHELGPASSRAVTFYEKIFGKSFAESDKGGKKFRFYVGLSSDVEKMLRGEKAAASKPAASKPAASKKPAKKPAASKKPKVVGKRRRAAPVCGKVVRRSDTFLNAVGKTFKYIKDKNHYDSTLSMKAACAIDAILRDSLDSVGTLINSLLRSSKSKTVDLRTAEFAVKMRFGGELAKMMVEGGKQTVKNINGSTDKKKSRAERAQTHIAPARVSRLLRKSRAATRFGKNVDVFLAGALDALSADLIGESLGMIKQSKSGTGRLSPRVVMLVISGDEELRKNFRGTVGSAGVAPMPEMAKKQKTK